MEIGWTKPKKALADWDDAPFNVVTNKQFKKIFSTKTTKEAQTILQTTYEGTKAVKDSKFQRLTTSFEDDRPKNELTPCDELID